MRKISEMKEEWERRKEFIREVLEPGDLSANPPKDGDYAKIPGTGNKDSLLQSGAEKILVLYHGARPRIVSEEVRDSAFDFTVEAVDNETEKPIGVGVGSADLSETKWAFVRGERACPACGQTGALKRSRNADEWYCWAKIGGCGKTFPLNDPAIVSQQTGMVPAPNVADSRNTARKIGLKRAVVALVLNLGWHSFFTQDLDERVRADDSNDQPDSPPSRPPADPPKAAQKPAPKEKPLPPELDRPPLRPIPLSDDAPPAPPEPDSGYVMSAPVLERMRAAAKANGYKTKKDVALWVATLTAGLDIVEMTDQEATDFLDMLKRHSEAEASGG